MASTAAPARRLGFDQARERVLGAASTLAARLETQQVALEEALGRILTEPFVAPAPFPAFDNTAVDGYAVRAADVAAASTEQPARLRVVERLGAGHVSAREVGRGEAVLLMTGASLPPGADCVVMRERTREARDEVEILAAASPGENVRGRGEDVATGETVLERGCELAPGDLAVLASFGRAQAAVVRRPRVAILSTGDELRAPGEPLGPGEIYDSNSVSIRSLVQAAGAEPGETWRVRDDRSLVAQALRQLLEAHDVVLSLGGVSAGDFDVVKLALADFEELELWRVGMRPGGPQAFGVLGGRVFYGLPGNPVSSAVVFDRLARPLLRAAMGARVIDRPVARARLAEPVRSLEGRRDFPRVRLSGSPGAYEARLTGSQSSGSVSSLAKADALAVIPESMASAEKGTEVDVILWRDV